MDNDFLRIPKHAKTVTAWVHPEGRVTGSIYVLPQSSHYSGEERPIEVLNHQAPFLVMRCEDPDEVRLYNKRFVVRVQYPGDAAADFGELGRLDCALHMMDGSILSGTIREPLAPEYSRLLDYVNRVTGDFMTIYLADGEVCLVNRGYIVRVVPRD